MNAFISRERLAEIFDQVIREITQQEAGIILQSSDLELNGELCTVYTAFERGYHTSLSLCAEMSMFVRLTKGMLQEEKVTLQEVELFTKEYFNVLCGHIVSQLYQITKVPARFRIPAFYQGRYVPDDHLKHIVLTYSSDEDEGAQLIYHALSAGHAEQRCLN